MITNPFSLGIAVDILTFVSDTTLIAALYVILAPINRHLALYAAFLRMAAVSLGVVMAADVLDVLRVLSGAEYLRAFEADQLAVLARLGIGSHTAQYNVVFVFLGWARSCSRTSG